MNPWEPEMATRTSERVRAHKLRPQGRVTDAGRRRGRERRQHIWQPPDRRTRLRSRSRSSRRRRRPHRSRRPIIACRRRCGRHRRCGRVRRRARLAWTTTAGGAALSRGQQALALLDALDQRGRARRHRRAAARRARDAARTADRARGRADPDRGAQRRRRASGVAGIDIEIRDGSVEVEETNVDDIVNLTISATATGTVDGEALPIGDLVRRRRRRRAVRARRRRPPSRIRSRLPITAVREDGRWYLSVFHTHRRAAARPKMGDRDIPDDGVAPAGGDTPEDAMDTLLDGVEALDLEAVYRGAQSRRVPGAAALRAAVPRRRPGRHSTRRTSDVTIADRLGVHRLGQRRHPLGGDRLPAPSTVDGEDDDGTVDARRRLLDGRGRR